MFGGWRKSFKDFLSHIGMPPETAVSLDRIDPNNGYFPGNVRWTTRMVQGLNTTKTNKNGERNILAFPYVNRHGIRVYRYTVRLCTEGHRVGVFSSTQLDWAQAAAKIRNDFILRTRLTGQPLIDAVRFEIQDKMPYTATSQKQIMVTKTYREIVVEKRKGVARVL